MMPSLPAQDSGNKGAAANAAGAAGSGGLDAGVFGGAPAGSAGNAGGVFGMDLNARIAAIEKQELGINEQIMGVARTMGHVSVTHYGNLEGLQKGLSDQLDTLAEGFFSRE